LIGIPLTAGFTGKFMIFFGAMAVPGEQTSLFTILAFLGVINAAIGGWYYLRLVAVMYLRTSVKPLEVRRNIPGMATLGICLILTIGLSIPPAATWLMEAARESANAKR
jgi:NADH-quinone oxidoreductase subunit N